MMNSYGNGYMLKTVRRQNSFKLMLKTVNRLEFEQKSQQLLVPR